MQENNKKIEYRIPNGEFKALKEDVNWLKSRVSEMATALLGSEYHEKGWIERVRDLEERRTEELEQRIEKLERFRWTVYGAVSVVSISVGIILWMLV